jgi:hypothetical protein
MSDYPRLLMVMMQLMDAFPYLAWSPWDDLVPSNRQLYNTRDNAHEKS